MGQLEQGLHENWDHMSRDYSNQWDHMSRDPLKQQELPLRDKLSLQLSFLELMKELARLSNADLLTYAPSTL
jgi:hypothetical protein